MVHRLLQRLRSEQGTAALETLISIPLMLAVMIAFWGGAVIIYNQMTLNSATQASAQSALTIYDRQTYSGGQASGYGDPAGNATRVAQAVYAEGVRGMLTDQLKNERPVTAAPVVSILCGDTITDITSTPRDCGAAGAAVEHVRVTGASTSGYWVLHPFVSGATRGTAAMRSTGDAVSVTAAAVQP